MASHGYLASLKERVVVFDGAAGTNLQLAALSADDYGGVHFEGCTVDSRRPWFDQDTNGLRICSIRMGLRPI